VTLSRKTACVLVSVLLSLSSLSQLASAQAPVDWPLMNSNPQGTNYVDQDQIDGATVAGLALAWTFPFPASPPVPGLAAVGQGSISPPLVVNGIVYLVTGFLRVYAIDAATGTVVWSYDPKLNITGLPLSPLIGHIHGINYHDGDVWVSMPDCSVLGLEALTGKLVAKFSQMCSGVPGNSGFYEGTQVPPVFYKGLMIWTSPVDDGSDVGRGFVAAYDVASQKLAWRWYVVPPAGGDPLWDAHSCPLPCQGNVAPVDGDWGTLGSANGTLAGAGPTFGDPLVDNGTGLVYVSTSQPSPAWNGSYRPGPDLYSDSVVALNGSTGTMVWFFQTTPHDLYDFDCGWNTVLGNVTVGGETEQAVFKACKNGYLYALNAATGKLLWYFDPPSVVRSLTGNADYVVTGEYSGTLPWLNYPSTQPFTQCPGENGAIESDVASAYGMVYVAAMNFCTTGQVGPVNTQGSTVWGVKDLQPDFAESNTTIYAVHASNGTVAWSYFIPQFPFRGWLTVTGGLVFASSLDGSVHELDAMTGRQVHELYVGPALYEGPTFGSTASGSVYMFQLTSAASYGGFASGTPGSLIAFGLPSRAGFPWQTYVPFALVGVLAAVAAVLVLENRSLRRRVKQGGP